MASCQTNSWSVEEPQLWLWNWFSHLLHPSMDDTTSMLVPNQSSMVHWLYPNSLQTTNISWKRWQIWVMKWGTTLLDLCLLLNFWMSFSPRSPFTLLLRTHLSRRDVLKKLFLAHVKPRHINHLWVYLLWSPLVINDLGCYRSKPLHHLHPVLTLLTHLHIRTVLASPNLVSTSNQIFACTLKTVSVKGLQMLLALSS